MKQLIKSIQSAIQGICHVWSEEPNFRIEVVSGIIAILFSLLIGLSRIDFILVLLLTSMVLILELMNTLVERFIDIAKPRLHNYVEIIKNTMAAIVLSAVVVSGIIGVLIFYPYVMAFLLS